MDKKVLAYNLNYPFRTSPDYCWFVATDNGDTLGFIPVELKEKPQEEDKKAGNAIINNYYIADDDSHVFLMLLKEVVQALLPDFELDAIVQKQHIPFFEQNEFSIVVYWTRYVKMKAFRHEKKCV
jgi:hypothetical protein